MPASWQMRSVGFPSRGETIRIESRPWLLAMDVWRSVSVGTMSGAVLVALRATAWVDISFYVEKNANWVCPQLTCSSQSRDRKRRQTSPLIIIIGYRVNDRMCLPATSDDWWCIYLSKSWEEIKAERCAQAQDQAFGSVGAKRGGKKMPSKVTMFNLQTSFLKQLSSSKSAFIIYSISFWFFLRVLFHLFFFCRHLKQENGNDEF